MVFQQEMRLPIDVELMPITGDSMGEMEDDVEGAIQILLEKHCQVFEKVEKSIRHAQQKQKETYDRKHQLEELPVGTEVMIENTAQLQRKGGKLDNIFKGIYFIHESLGKGLYSVKNQQGTILQKKVNISRLKVYKRRTEPSNPTEMVPNPTEMVPNPTEPSNLKEIAPNPVEPSNHTQQMDAVCEVCSVRFVYIQ